MSSWLDITENTNLQLAHGRLELTDRTQPENLSSNLCLLDSQAILCVKGEGAAKFLQGQSTADIEGLAVGESTLGAICTNKGRVICNFRALKTEDAILLRMSADIVQETLDRIAKYAVFFKAELSYWSSPCVSVILNPEGFNAGLLPAGVYKAEAENGSIELYAEPGEAQHLYASLKNDYELASESAWYAMQIESGQTSINVCTIEKYLPHQLNLDKSGAVSFTKGCYTGQEIVARTEYKGKTKRRVLPALLHTDLGDLHTARLSLSADASQELELLVAAKTGPNQTLVALLLPVDFPDQGNVFVGGKEIGYTRLDLPYAIEGES